MNVTHNGIALANTSVIISYVSSHTAEISASKTHRYLVGKKTVIASNKGCCSLSGLKAMRDGDKEQSGMGGDGTG